MDKPEETPIMLQFLEEFLKIGDKYNFGFGPENIEENETNQS